MSGNIIVHHQQLLGNDFDHVGRIEGVFRPVNGIDERMEGVAGDFAILVNHQLVPARATHTATAGHSDKEYLLDVTSGVALGEQVLWIL